MRIRSWHLGAALVTVVVILCFASELISGQSFQQQNPEQILLSPNAQHWFGTDSLGRDLFTRVFYGARLSLLLALISSVGTLILGVFIGALAGWRGQWTDRFFLRTVDTFQAIPSFLLVSVLCLFLQSVLPGGDFTVKILVSLALSIVFTHWFNIAKITRGQTKQIKTLPYVEAAVALGASPWRIFLRHMLPNMQGTLWVLFAMQIPASILYESMISFAGYGLQSPQVSWGILLQEGWRSLSQFPHLLLLPALVLFLTVLGFHLMFYFKTKVREFRT